MITDTITTDHFNGSHSQTEKVIGLEWAIYIDGVEMLKIAGESARFDCEIEARKVLSSFPEFSPKNPKALPLHLVEHRFDRMTCADGPQWFEFDSETIAQNY